eukprot:m.481047 g.481047  ORF g.481047 m.481047 type:complete len:69 (-) comp55293_c0_seq1:23-229(-)
MTPLPENVVIPTGVVRADGFPLSGTLVCNRMRTLSIGVLWFGASAVFCCLTPPQTQYLTSVTLTTCVV